MPDFRKALFSGINPGFQEAINQNNKTLEGQNPSAANFLKGFMGGDMRLQDNSGTIQFNPQTGNITGTSSDPQSYRFSINPLNKSASVGKGSFELSGGLGLSQKDSPWGMVGFKFPASNGQNIESTPDFSSNDEYQQNHPASRLPPAREFASSDVEELYNQTVGKPNRKIWSPDSQPYLR
jgi:hypothetical protein